MGASARTNWWLPTLAAAVVCAGGCAVGQELGDVYDAYDEADGGTASESEALDNKAGAAGLGVACRSDADCASGNCHEEGATDRCRPASCSASDDVHDHEFCDLDNCGPCRAGEGDCDQDNQCLSGECKQVQGHDTCAGGNGGLGDSCKSDADCASGNCHEEGATDRCRPSSCTSGDSVNHREFCEPSVCGPCRVGEGDCDDNNQCLGDAECVEEGTTDVCRSAGSGGGGGGGGVEGNGDRFDKCGSWMPARGTFVVFHNGERMGLRCRNENEPPELVASANEWRLDNKRRLRDLSSDLELYCREGGSSCTCRGKFQGEWFHSGDVVTGQGRGPVQCSLLYDDFGWPIHPDANSHSSSVRRKCLKVKGNTLVQEDSSNGCTHFTFLNWTAL